MAEVNGKIRIKDIAELAGVSKGTVDRVLHNRGEVSRASREKVEKVLEEINYHPNIHASALASKKRYNFHCILPDHETADYWAYLEMGIEKQVEELLDLNVNVVIHYYNQYDVDSCRQVYASIPDLKPDGVLMSPLFKDSSNAFAAKLKELNIPFVFVDSQVEGVEPLAYFGMHSYQSGHLAAKLLVGDQYDIKDIVMFHAKRKGETGANQTIQRKAGFMAYIKENNPDCRIHSVGLYWNDRDKNDIIMDQFFRENPGIKNSVIFNSRVYMVADYFKKSSMKDMTVLGYDLVDRNVKCLKNGAVSYLIAQRPEIQGYRALKALAQHLIYKQEVKPVNYMPIDILTAENIDFYVNFPSI